MDAEQHEQALLWLKKHWRYGKCPVCHAEDWSFYPRLGEISNFRFGGRQIPLLLLGCDTCGYVVPINALTAGVEAKAEGSSTEVEFPPEPPSGWKGAEEDPD